MLEKQNLMEDPAVTPDQKMLCIAVLTAVAARNSVCPNKKADCTIFGIPVTSFLCSSVLCFTLCT